MTIRSERDVLRNMIDKMVFTNKKDVIEVEEICDFYYEQRVISMNEFDDLISFAEYRYEKSINMTKGDCNYACRN